MFQQVMFKHIAKGNELTFNEDHFDIKIISSQMGATDLQKSIAFFLIPFV